MKLISFLFSLSTAMGIFQSFYGVNTLRDVPPAGNDRKYKNVYKLSETYLQEHGLYKVSLNDDFIQMSRMQQKYFPKSHFDRTFTMNALYSVTQYYLLENTPYDSIYSSEKKVKERELYFSTRYNQDKLQELDEEYKNEMLNNPNITAIKRGEFWDMVFEFNKRYASSEGFAIIEKSIREAHEALALGWDDVIYIEKNEFDEHKAAVEHIFTDLKDEVNKIYLK